MRWGKYHPKVPDTEACQHHHELKGMEKGWQYLYLALSFPCHQTVYTSMTISMFSPVISMPSGSMYTSILPWAEGDGVLKGLPISIFSPVISMSSDSTQTWYKMSLYRFRLGFIKCENRSHLKLIPSFLTQMRARIHAQKKNWWD